MINVNRSISDNTLEKGNEKQDNRVKGSNSSNNNGSSNNNNISNGRRKDNKGSKNNDKSNDSVTSLPWPHRQMYSCIRQKGGRTSSKSPRRRVAKIPEFQKDNHYNVQSKMRGQ